MKKLLLLMLMNVCIFSHAQILLEDNDVTENFQEFGRVQILSEVNHPVEFYRLNCNSPVYAQFPGGEMAFRQKIGELLKYNLSDDVYAVNGTFSMILHVDSEGKLHSVQLRPEITNGFLLERDLALMMENVKERWTPASCNGEAVNSRIRLRINLKSEFFDS